MPKTTQDDHVKEDQGFKPSETTDRVTVPGLAQLHSQSTSEIAEVLTNVLKSRPNITRLTYQVGEYIELTSTND